jgi:hypothetical protein
LHNPGVVQGHGEVYLPKVELHSSTDKECTRQELAVLPAPYGEMDRGSTDDNDCRHENADRHDALV